MEILTKQLFWNRFNHDHLHAKNIRWRIGIEDELLNKIGEVNIERLLYLKKNAY